MTGITYRDLQIGNKPYPKYFVFVEGGTFMMGSKEFVDERPIHEVTVPSFYIARYPLTQEIYETVMGENPSCFKVSERPVELVSWLEAKIFCEKLERLTVEINFAFRLRQNGNTPHKAAT